MLLIVDPKIKDNGLLDGLGVILPQVVALVSQSCKWSYIRWAKHTICQDIVCSRFRRPSRCIFCLLQNNKSFLVLCLDPRYRVWVSHYHCIRMCIHSTQVPINTSGIITGGHRKKDKIIKSFWLACVYNIMCGVSTWPDNDLYTEHSALFTHPGNEKVRIH